MKDLTAKDRTVDVLRSFENITEGELRKFYISRYIVLILSEYDGGFIICWFRGQEQHLTFEKRSKGDLQTTTYKI